MRISVVCIPLRKFLFLETATREEEENCEEKNDDENDKQTYRDFVDIIRFARGPPDLPEAHADIFFPSSYARIQSRESRLDIHLTVLPSRIVLRAIIDFIEHSFPSTLSKQSLYRRFLYFNGTFEKKMYA